MKSESFASRVAQCRPRLLAAAAALLLSLAACGYGNSGCYYSCGPVGPVNVPNSIAVADVNADGVPDLLVATTLDQGGFANPGFANVILGVGGTPGTFATGVQYATTGSNPSSIAVADLTGSGKLDLVIANYGSGSVSVFMHGATAGTFQTAVNVVTGGAPNQVVIGDLNGDGHPDLVLADLRTSGNVIVLFQDPANPGSFQAPVNLPTGKVTSSVAVANLAGNPAGPLDIVAATYDAAGDNGAVYVFMHGASAGTFLAPVTFPAGAQPQAVRIADVNGDGLPDIIVANYFPGADGIGIPGVSVLLQDPANPGHFLAPVTYPTPDGAIDVAVGDLDGDGRPDLVVATIDPDFTGGVSVLLQNAAPAQAGTFGTATVYAGFGQPLSVAIADLNADGHPDIAVADSTSATILLQNANAPGTFANAVQVGK